MHYLHYYEMALGWIIMSTVYEMTVTNLCNLDIISEKELSHQHNMLADANIP